MRNACLSTHIHESVVLCIHTHETEGFLLFNLYSSVFMIAPRVWKRVCKNYQNEIAIKEIAGDRSEKGYEYPCFRMLKLVLK